MNRFGAIALLLVVFGCKDAPTVDVVPSAPEGCEKVLSAFDQWKVDDDAFTARLENETDPQKLIVLLEKSVGLMEKRVEEASAIQVEDPRLRNLLNESIDLARPAIPMIQSTVNNIRGGHLQSLAEQLEVLQTQVKKGDAVDVKIRTYCKG